MAQSERLARARFPWRCASHSRLACLVFCAAVLLDHPADARDLWERTRSPELARERDILGAVERVLLGVADDHDVLAAQSALVEYTRGKRYEDVRVEVLLVRLRLEARWTYDARLEKRLGTTLERSGPPAAMGRAWLDWGALGALRGDARAAAARFERGLALVWERGARAEGLLGRGYARMALGHAREAASDFDAAVRLADTGRITAAALWSLALAESRSGRGEEALRAGRFALEVERRRASASGRDAFDGVARVPSYDVHALAALRARVEGQIARESADEDDEASARKNACEAERKYLLHAEPDGAPWVSQAQRAWRECS